MAYICEICGEQVEDELICSCVIESKKEALKNRKKKYLLINSNGEDLITALLKARQIDEDSQKFIEGKIDGLLNNTFLNEEKAISIILDYLENKKKIGIYGDYDADGITGIAVAISILRKLGGDVTYYVNNRFTEGFGIGPTGVEALKKENVDLIITVDNGIAGIEGVGKANELGMTVIVTDHHEPNDILPNALIVDPKQDGCTYPNKEITGVGVIFKILLRVCEKLDRKNLALKQLDLVALGTVADLGALVGENRVIVKNGLMLWNWDKCRLNLKFLKDKLNLKRTVTSYDLGFIYGPILNAESRLYGKPEKAVEWLITENPKKMESLCSDLVKMNEERKSNLEKQLVISDSLVDPTKDFFFIYDSCIEEGLAGLIASRIMDTYKRPTIVLKKDSNNNVKGSGRSFEPFNLKEALDNVKSFLLSYGGHALACGITLDESQLVVVKNILETKGLQFFKDKDIVDEVIIDGSLGTHHLTESFIDLLEQLEPFGMGFKRPSFIMKDIPVRDLLILKEKHSKFSYNNINFIAFNKILERNNDYHFIGYPKWNIYNGRKKIQFVIHHVLDKETEICELETSTE
ncbi:hypothetical protein AZF37_00025 [endosymbiont 'TC1' of Trimyema compressum]|uniref:single-stranded-DNA-specific exonuclease RecJ n=1 Tax=endosymbiont 'TC1' of Trimyema compressum TaxID=243899 RepID=UPI0007F08C88|nr:single-stranded-DNA-specific exonuclease RecJ [endosymbiont 'TC1' of Trimyema compressum]AMP19772.1 hypothetical protein AZF37_00025 [endosymbiont 'TC1' of Trimyema compressum]